MPNGVCGQGSERLEAPAHCGESEMTEDFAGVSNIDQQVHSSGGHAVSITAHHGIYR
jgi:hypothetical protein